MTVFVARVFVREESRACLPHQASGFSNGVPSLATRDHESTNDHEYLGVPFAQARP